MLLVIVSMDKIPSIVEIQIKYAEGTWTVASAIKSRQKQVINAKNIKIA